MEGATHHALASDERSFEMMFEASEGLECGFFGVTRSHPIGPPRDARSESADLVPNAWIPWLIQDCRILQGSRFRKVILQRVKIFAVGWIVDGAV